LEYIFICKECGRLQKNQYETWELKCENCHSPMNWNNSFPPMAAIDFINSARDLFQQSKNCDKENLDSQYDVIEMSINMK